MAENLAGVLIAGGVAAGALLLRDAVVVNGGEQLGVPLQTDEGELPQGDIEPPGLTAKAQLTAKAGADAGGNLGDLAVTVAAFAHVHQLDAQHNGVHRLYYPHQIGKAIKVYPNHRAFSGLYAHFRPY